jgi:MoaA/NifB/PqqE/SkfB family radical SAM enzyme
MNLLKFSGNLYFSKKQPISIVHFVTHRCIARCKHCFIDFDNPSIFKNELTLNEIDKLTKNLGDNLFNVNLTGGEPFLRKDLYEIALLYQKNSHVKSIFISTNGMLTSAVEKFANSFISEKNNTNLKISISIDNFEKEHDENRKLNGLFKNAIRTYLMLKSYSSPRISSNIGITVTNHNYKNVIKLYDYLKRIGVKSITATIMREEGVVEKIDIRIKKAILEAYKSLSDLINKDQMNGIMPGFGYHAQGLLMNSKNRIMEDIIKEIYLKSKYISNCPAASLFGIIYANGDVYPCEILPRKLGNLRDYKMNFIKLWRSNATRECNKFIKDTKCNCTFECAWTVNILSTPKFLPTLLLNAARIKKWTR